jgi:hypothetical protein
MLGENIKREIKNFVNKILEKEDFEVLHKKTNNYF